MFDLQPLVGIVLSHAVPIFLIPFDGSRQIWRLCIGRDYARARLGLVHLLRLLLLLLLGLCNANIVFQVVPIYLPDVSMLSSPSTQSSLLR